MKRLKIILIILAVVLLISSAVFIAMGGFSNNAELDIPDPDVWPTETAKNTAAPLPTEEALVLSNKVICVDAGHGKNTDNFQEPIAPGSTEKKIAFATGTAGGSLTEEELNLLVALKLEEKLKALGADVYMTRTTHETMYSNVGRAEFANELGADISIKLHADGGASSSAYGISMLIPGDKYIKDEAMLSKSKQAGELILASVVKTTGGKNNGISIRNDLTGFNWSRVPIVLLEMGFMTNPDECALLETDEYQNKIADGIVQGVVEYFGYTKNPGSN